MNLGKPTFLDECSKAVKFKNQTSNRWMWDVGVGEIVNVDEKGRIIIPVEIRKIINKKTFSVEMADKNTIILRATGDSHDLAERIEAIHLTGDDSRASTDFSDVKDPYGGKRVETA